MGVIDEGAIRHETERPDGTRLAVFESGIHDAGSVLLLDGVGCDGFIWRYLAPALATRTRVVHPHYRGHGESSWAGGETGGRYRRHAADGYGIDVLADDSLAVMDELGIDRAVLIGHSMGVQVALEMATRAPERVTGIVLVCGSYGRPLDTVYDSAMLGKVLPAARIMAEQFPEVLSGVMKRLLPTELGWWMARLLEVDGRLVTRDDMLAYLGHMAAIDPRIFLETLDAAGEHTAEAALPGLTMPSLVLGGERDGFTPYWVSEVMARRLGNAELQLLRGGTHTASLEHRELVERLVTDFLDRRCPGVLEARPDTDDTLAQKQA
ncbi:MAG: alpha/beta hydrolase [Myxococcales bacterium]|nr:alpha/beta hydrolase [Myxococcales bacterium]